MALENATYIAELNAANPTAASDSLSTWDDHLRLIKSVLVNSFGAVTAPVTATEAELNIADGLTVMASELNVLDGITGTTVTELNFLSGLTSNFQTQLTARITMTIEAKTSSFTAAANYYYVTGGLLTVTLPASPSVGDIIYLFFLSSAGRPTKLVSGTVPVNGGSALNEEVTTNQTRKFIYVDSTTGWAMGTYT
jgi:hypothetical protein